MFFEKDFSSIGAPWSATVEMTIYQLDVSNTSSSAPCKPALEMMEGETVEAFAKTII